MLKLIILATSVAAPRSATFMDPVPRRSSRLPSTTPRPPTPVSRRRPRFDAADYVEWSESEEEDNEIRRTRARTMSEEKIMQDEEFALAQAIDQQRIEERERLARLEEEARIEAEQRLSAAKLEEEEAIARQSAEIDLSKQHLETLAAPVNASDECIIAVLLPSGRRVTRAFRNSDIFRSIVHMVVAESTDPPMAGTFRIIARGSEAVFDENATLGDLGLHRSVLIVRQY